MPVVKADSISDAWKQVVSICLESRGHQIHALSVEIVCGKELDDLKFRNRVNRALVAAEKATVDTVARTIFPIGLWNPRHSRSELFERYIKILPKLRRYALNRRGLYFVRLINYACDREGSNVKNQL